MNAASERIWECGRGRSRLCCRLHQRADEALEIEVRRNDRLYGTYQFVERDSALTFADRLRFMFEANGWLTAVH